MIGNGTWIITEEKRYKTLKEWYRTEAFIKNGYRVGLLATNNSDFSIFANKHKYMIKTG